MRIKVNPKENSLTGDKMKRGGEAAENHVKKVHNYALLLKLLSLVACRLSLSFDGFHFSRQTRHFA